MKEKIIYYTDELNDEFSGDNIKPKKIDGNYKYHSNSLFYKICHFFFYRVIATPLAYIYLKLKFHHKIKNKKCVKAYKKSGYFLYGNHTQNIGDAVIPSFITIPKDVYLIVHPNNVSMPVLGKITPFLGALPLPDDFKASKNFVTALEKRLNEKNAVVVYPEAHIWPYYTKIRPFTDASFRYPVNLKLPVFSFVNTYRKRKHGKGVNIVTVVDGPFFADESLPPKEQRKKLRDEVYFSMVKASEKSDIEVIKYIKKDIEKDKVNQDD